MCVFCLSDTICDLGGVDELANYGEYSGAPSEQQTYDYAKTILSLMTREKHPNGECDCDVVGDGYLHDLLQKKYFSVCM